MSKASMTLNQLKTAMDASLLDFIFSWYRLYSKRCFTNLITLSRHNTSLTHFYFEKSSSSYDSCLPLSFRYVFNEDTIHWMPTSVGVSKLMSCDAFSNRKSHLHLSFLNVIAVTFSVVVTVKIVVSACLHVECTVNSSRRAALGCIEGKIPATTAAVTVVNLEVTSIVAMEGISSQSHSSKRDTKKQHPYCIVYFYLLHSIEK